MSLDDCNDCAVLAHHELAGEQFCHDRGGEYWAMSFDGENTLPPPKSLVFYCDSPRSAQEPIDACFSKVADHVTANRLAVEVPSLQSRVFPIGWESERASIERRPYPTSEGAPAGRGALASLRALCSRQL